MRACALLLVGWLFLLTGCGGGSGSAGQPISVTISPAAASIAPAATQTFTAAVANTTNTAVTWSVQEGATGGSITNAGVYTAPAAAGTYHIVATSQADAAKTAVVPVAVHIAVAISPTTITLSPGQAVPFTAAITGTSNTAVTWSIQEGAAGGAITNAGVYTPTAANGTFHIIAISQADPSQQAIATVVVQSGSATGAIN